MAGIDRWWDDLTRERAAAVLELVLNAISDDYENVEIIRRIINGYDPDEPGLKNWKALAAVPVSRLEVVNGLRELVAEGFAQASIYDPEAKDYQPVSFRPDMVSVLWFYVTEKGMEAVDRIHKRHTETAQ